MGAGVTGWPLGLMQDDCRGLSRWLSSRIDARVCVRRVCAEIVAAKTALTKRRRPRIARTGPCGRSRCLSPISSGGLCNAHYHAQRQAARPYKACACGCGELAQANFVNGHNTRLLPAVEQQRRGQLNDGSAQRDTGAGNWYRKVGGRHEHRIVAEEMLGRDLLPGEIVHHKDHDKRNNDPLNLEVMTQSEHVRRHMRERAACR